MYAYPGVEVNRLQSIIDHGFARIDRAVDRIIGDYEQGESAAIAVGRFLAGEGLGDVFVRVDPLAAYLAGIGYSQQNAFHSLHDIPQGIVSQNICRNIFVL